MIESGMFTKMIYIEPLVSFQSIVNLSDYSPKYVMSAVSGGIKLYDLPQLLSVQKAQSVLLIGPVSGSGIALNNEEVNQAYQGIINSQKIIASQAPYGDETYSKVSNFLKE